MPASRNLTSIFVSGLLALSVGTAACGGDAKEPEDGATTTTTTTAPSPTTEPTTIEADFGDGATIHDGTGAELEVTLSSTAVPPDPAESGNELVEIFLTLENTGDVAYSGNPSEGATLYSTPSGAAEPVVGEAGITGPFGEQVTDLNAEITLEPGESIDGFIVFEIPPGEEHTFFDIVLEGGSETAEWSF